MSEGGIEAENQCVGKKDFAWKYARRQEGEKIFYCKFCRQKCTGTITRLKNHLAGTHNDMKPCPSVPPEVKKECRDSLRNFQVAKSKRSDLNEEIGIGPRGEFGPNSRQLTSESVDGNSGPTRAPRPSGPMDRFTTSQSSQQTLNSKWKKEERIEVCRKIGRLVFNNALPFRLVDDPYWKNALDAVANFGPGFKGPSGHELRTSILKAEVEDINSMMKEHRTIWEESGCSIMCDGWSDGCQRQLINFLVNSAAGTWFLKSVDASDSIKNGDLMFNYLDEVVEVVGEANVIQVITDNAKNMIRGGRLLMEKRKNLFWTPCAAHCIDLMLEDIGKMTAFERTISKTKQVVKFIYGHSFVLALMREMTNGGELLRPAVTRFATCFLTLQSVLKQKKGLQTLFLSDKWLNSSYAKLSEGTNAQKVVLFDPIYWTELTFCIRGTSPLVSVLREVDSEERPAMGYIYELMDKAKERIAEKLGNVEKRYRPIWRKIDERWTPQLHHPLHAAGYYLNPQLRYKSTFSNCKEVREGLHQCLDRMLNYDERVTVDVQLDEYTKRRKMFGTKIAQDTIMRRSPADWWMRFGSDTPELQKFAIRILGLTCSASGCERNWSTFESIHTKKRNKLEFKRLNALVYVKYNSKLRERSLRRRQNVDPILVEEMDSDDEWITEKEQPVLPNDGLWLDEDHLFEADAIRNLPITNTNAPSIEKDVGEVDEEFVLDDTHDSEPIISNKRMRRNSESEVGDVGGSSVGGNTMDTDDLEDFGA